MYNIMLYRTNYYISGKMLFILYAVIIVFSSFFFSYKKSISRVFHPSPEKTFPMGHNVTGMP